MVGITSYRRPKPSEPFRRFHRSTPSEPSDAAGPVIAAVRAVPGSIKPGMSQPLAVILLGDTNFRNSLLAQQVEVMA